MLQKSALFEGEDDVVAEDPRGVAAQLKMQGNELAEQGKYDSKQFMHEHMSSDGVYHFHRRIC